MMVDLVKKWREDAEHYSQVHTAFCQKKGRGAVSGRNVSRALKDMSLQHADELEAALESQENEL